MPELVAKRGQARPCPVWPVQLLTAPRALSCAEEIVAHASNVSSLVLGKGSGRLLATGGDDCRVNLWSINKPNCIMVSLGGRWGRGGEGTVSREGLQAGAGTRSSGRPSQGLGDRAPRPCLPQLSAQGAPGQPQVAGTVAGPQAGGHPPAVEQHPGSLHEKVKTNPSLPYPEPVRPPSAVCGGD